MLQKKCMQNNFSEKLKSDNIMVYRLPKDETEKENRLKLYDELHLMRI